MSVAFFSQHQCIVLFSNYDVQPRPRSEPPAAHFCGFTQDHLSQPGSPFYVGAMIESLDAVSTSGSWKRQAGTPKGLRARSSSFWNSAVTRKRNGAKTGGRVSRGTTAPEAEGVVAGTGGRDKLVKKELSLNQLALYWNPAEDGNPCSMYLSDIPVEQAEVVMSRREEACSEGRLAVIE